MNDSSVFNLNEYIERTKLSLGDEVIQLDGMDDSINLDDKEEPIKFVFGINCEFREIIHLISFFRSFNLRDEYLKSILQNIYSSK